MKLHRIGASAAVLAMAIAARGAMAQKTPAKPAAAPGEVGVGEIVVTAQKRAENVQTVPIAISAMGEAQLQQRGITNITQMSNFTPSVQIDRASPFAGSSTIMSAYIRGIGQNDFAFNMEPGVGLYVDGVYYARTVGAAVDLVDVSRVEMLKGPQGTLFGRNTIGGAISVVTADPTHEFAFKGNITAGSYSRLDIKAMVNIPISNTLAASLSVSSNHQDGYQHRIPYTVTGTEVNPLTGTVTGPAAGSPILSNEGNFLTARPVGGSNRQGGENSRTIRGKLKWTPNDDLSIVVAGDYTHANEEAAAETLLATNQALGQPGGNTFATFYNLCVAGVSGAPGICQLHGRVNTNLLSTGTRLPYGNSFITGNIDTTYANGANFSDVTAWGVSGTVDYKLLPDLSVKSITAFRKLNSAFGTDIDGSPLDMGETTFSMNQKQFSQELQFNLRAFDNRLKSVLGAYYFNETGNLVDQVVFGEGLIQVYGPNDFKNKAWALFSHNNVQITGKLGATFGIRYTEENKDFTGGQSDLNQFAVTLGVPPFLFPDPSNLNRVFPLGTFHQKFTNTSIRAGLEYRFTRDVMAYASFAQGYKSGGWTTRLAVPLALTTALNPDPTQPPTHRPEHANTYEIGLKSEWLDRRLRLNVTGFWSDYKDMQLTVTSAATGFTPWFINAGQSRIRGIEIDTEARPTPALRLTGSISYMEAKYVSLGAAALAAGFNLSDLLPNTPKWSGSLGATYTADLGEKGSLAFHGDLNFKSRMAKDYQNDFIQGWVNLVNANIAYTPPSEHWSLTLGADNIFNKRYIVTGNQNDGFGAKVATYNRPATWYARLGVKF